MSADQDEYQPLRQERYKDKEKRPVPLPDREPEDAQHGGNRRRLDRRRRLVAFSRQGLKERPGEAEVIKLFQVVTFVRRGAATKRPMALDGIVP